MNWLKRLFSPAEKAIVSRPTFVPTSTPKEQAKALADIDEKVGADVAAAFRTEEEIITGTIEYFNGTYELEAIRPLVVERTKHFFAQHRAAEQTWPDVTDCDRLDRAFAELEARGIVCRQDFACCSTCGHYEIGDELEATRKQGTLVRGYAFYHMQDTERAAMGDGVYLAYGATEDGPLAATRIAHEICEATRAAGLTVEWNGEVTTRVLVKLDWKRRRTPRCARSN